MKLLFLASRDIANPQAAGGDITMFRAATLMAARGHHVRYICTASGGESNRPEVPRLYVDRIGSLYTTSLRFAVLRWKNLATWTDAIVEEVIGGIRVPYLSPLYADKPRVCFWYQLNGLIFKQQFGRLLGSLLAGLEYAIARLYQNSTIITPSHQSKRALTELGFSGDRIRVAPPGVSDRMLRLAAEISPSKSPLIVSIGKFRRYKCLHHAVSVLRHLHETSGLDGVRLVIAGRREDLGYEEFIRSLIKKYKLDRWVDVKVNISEREKAILLSKAGALLITSPVEGFGITAIEASLFGTPVVATMGVPSEAVRDGFDGYRVPFGDIAAFADRIERLLSGKSETKRMQQNAKNFARGFSWERTADVLDEALEELLEG